MIRALAFIFVCVLELLVDVFVVSPRADHGARDPVGAEPAARAAAPAGADRRVGRPAGLLPGVGCASVTAALAVPQLVLPGSPEAGTVPARVRRRRR
jgi:hypothetical protein